LNRRVLEARKRPPMPTAYLAAVETLYRGPLDTFVTERKRLAGELKSAGDKEGAARLLKLGRPTVSAWAVNQLWWHEREAFERLFASAEGLKKGKREAGAEHREALTALRALAADQLVSAGHAAAESTLRRVTLTLSALAAAGSFEPDPAGALASDRDPPGFDALGSVSTDADEEPDTPAAETKHGAGDDAHAKRREQAERERKRAAEERQRLEEERARKKAEREKIKSELSTAQGDAATLHREAERLRHELHGVEAKLDKARDRVEKLKAALAALG
jgi:hypothetical protein